MPTVSVPADQVGTALLTLSPGVITIVNFANGVDEVEAISPAANVDVIWFTLDGTDPTIGGTNCYYLPPGSVDSRDPKNSVVRVVKLISAGSPTVRVQQLRPGF